MLTQERLKELLSYDPETGVFTWRVYKGNRAYPGDVAGSPDPNGYICVRIDTKSFLAHRLAYLYIQGYFPEHCVDHKNGVTSDNWWDNLRHATRICNMQNTKLQTNNKSGFPGVFFYKRDAKWEAKARAGGRVRFLGRHETALDAALARLTFEVQCPQWTCNHRGELIKAIKRAWPEFNIKSIS